MTEDVAVPPDSTTSLAFAPIDWPLVLAGLATTWLPLITAMAVEITRPPRSNTLPLTVAPGSTSR